MGSSIRDSIRDDVWLTLARLHGKLHSRDLNRKVGCMIVGDDSNLVTFGYNDIPLPESKHPERLLPPLKYRWTEHAERAAIYSAARSGRPVSGATLYVAADPAGLGICMDCARAIVLSGIRRVVAERCQPDDPWAEELAMAEMLLAEAGVLLDYAEK